jgi:hypothetical protein
MSQHKIMIIRENKLFYSQSDRNFARLTHDNIENDIEDYIEIKSIEQSTLMDEITTILNTPDAVAHTMRCYEDNEYIYELCYHSYIDNTKKSTINNIASHLTKFTDKVVGNAIILKSKINYNKTCELVDISLNDIVDIYKKIFVHTGVIVMPNGTIDEYNYIFNPIDLIKPDQMNNIRFYELKIFNRVIQLFIEVNPSDNTLNEYASILYNKSLINGKVIFGMRYTFDDVRMTETEYCDLTKDILKKIVYYASDNVNFSDSTSDQDINSITNSNTHQVNFNGSNTQSSEKITKVNTFYTMLDNEYNIYKAKYGLVLKKDCLEKLKYQQSLNDVTKSLVEQK